LIICYRVSPYKKADADNKFSLLMQDLLKKKEEKDGKVNFIEAFLFSEIKLNLNVKAPIFF